MIFLGGDVWEAVRRGGPWGEGERSVKRPPETSV